MAKKVVLQNHHVQWYLLFVLLLAFSHSGYAQEESATTQIRINPDAARGGTVSQYIYSVKFITFEGSSVKVGECLIFIRFVGNSLFWILPYYH